MLLNSEVLTLDILNIVLLFFATVAFYFTVKILFYYDENKTTSLQYSLEKQSYLVSTIIKFIFAIKIPLFIFFIFTLDKISNILPGAMCGAGVVNATVYGTPLFILKIINLYLFAYWIVLNKEDMKSEKREYLKLKFLVFSFVYILFLVEMFLQMSMFFSIDINSVVDCCGAIFSTTSQTYMAKILGASHKILLLSFYGLYVLIFLFYILKNRYIYAILNTVFVIVSLITLIAFFGTYIYELPTHHCPFCLLQSDYYYIGYLLYVVLFIGTFFGFVIGIINFKKDLLHSYFNISFLYISIYVLIVTYFPVSYYLKNGIFL